MNDYSVYDSFGKKSERDFVQYISMKEKNNEKEQMIYEHLDCSWSKII